MKTFKVLAALLDYPTDELCAAVPELRQVLVEERLLDGEARARLEPLLEALETVDAMALQERYVALFDRVRSLSLHLFEHVHGESRDRGQALVDLKQVYERHGYHIHANELPDFLPAFLEFLSRLPREEALELLAETSEILTAIAARLAKRGSVYAGVFAALLTLAGHAMPDANRVSDEDIRKEDDPATLDEAWQEEPAFRPGTPVCGAAKAPERAIIKFHKGAAA